MAQTAAPKQLFGNTLNLKILLLFFFSFSFSAISQKSIQHVSFGWMGNTRARVCEMQTLTALLIKCHSVDQLLTNSSGAFDLSTQIFQRGDRKVQTRLKYSAASLWLIGEAQLWIYWWHLTVGHKGGGKEKSHYFMFLYFPLLAFIFKQMYRCLPSTATEMLAKKQKKNQVHPDDSC